MTVVIRSAVQRIPWALWALAAGCGGFRPYSGGELLLFDSELEARARTRSHFTRVVAEDNFVSNVGTGVKVYDKASGATFSRNIIYRASTAGVRVDTPGVMLVDNKLYAYEGRA